MYVLMIKLYKTILRKTRSSILVASMLLCIPLSSFAAPMNGNYTINKSVAASSTNYTTFQSLFSALASNGVNGAVSVTVLNGPYTEQVSANAINGASAVNTITINGNGQTLSFSATSSSSQHTMMMNGADWVTIKNLTIQALGTTYAWGVRLTNNSDYITIDGCTIRVPNVTSTSSLNSVCITATASTTSPASSGANCKYLTVQNCVLTGGTTYGPYYGMCLYAQSSNSTVSGIKILNNTIKNFYVYGNYLYNCNDLEFNGNKITRDANYTRITTTYGMYIILCVNTKIRNNEIYNLFQAVSTTSTFYGILFTSNTTSGTQHEVSNNLIYNNTSNGSWFGIYLSCTYNVDVTHNTVSHQNNSPSSGTQYGVYLTCSYTGRSVKNNIINMDMGGASTRYGIYNGGITTIMDIDRNNIYVTGVNGYTGYYNGNQQTPKDWQSISAPGSPFDANSTFVNPNFVSTTVGSQLIPQSINIDDLGTPIAGVTTDFSGAPRSLTAPDPGAVEFTIDANVNKIETLGGLQTCLGQKDDVKVWIKNNSPIVLSGFNVTYTVNNTNPVSEAFTGSINPNDSAQFTFAKQVEYNTVGLADIRASIANKPKYGPYGVNVKPSPIGSEITKGTAFQGQFLTGSSNDPDIVANPDEITYEFTTPTGYLNSGYGSTWVINTFISTTAKNAIIDPSNIVRTNANSGGNYKVKVKPAASLTDDTIYISMAAYSLTTLCEAPLVNRAIFVAPRPTAVIDATDVCEKATMDLISKSTISSGSMKYKWEFGDGTVSDFSDNAKVYSTFGTYTVKLTATSNYGYSNTATKTVTVFEAPKVDYLYDNQCEGKAVPFTNNSTVANGSPVYSWDFGDKKGTSNAPSPNYTYTTPGTYFASLTVTDAKNCATTITKPVSYFKKPTADFVLPATICNQSEVMFTNASIASGNTGYSWDYGNGTVAQSAQGTTTYANTGNYIVKLIARNEFGCADTASKPFTITEAPIADFVTTGKCIGDPVTYTNNTNEPSGTTVDYEWNFGEDGANSTAKNGSYVYTAVGNYKITLKAKSTNGCTTQKETMVTFGEKPLVGFDLPANACEGKDVELRNSSKVSAGVLSYAWDLGNGNSTATNPVANYATAGNYNVSLVATSGIGCTSSASKSITITATPNSNFLIESSKTGNGGIILTPANPNGTAKYTWLYGDGGKGSEKGKHTYRFNSGLGLFMISLEVEENGCSSNTTQEVRINVLSVDDADANSLNVYPNPSNGLVGIYAQGIDGVRTLQIVDILGKIIYTGAVDFSAQEKIQIDLSHQKAGVYFVKIITDNEVLSGKVTIVK